MVDWQTSCLVRQLGIWEVVAGRFRLLPLPKLAFRFKRAVSSSSFKTKSISTRSVVHLYHTKRYLFQVLQH